MSTGPPLLHPAPTLPQAEAAGFRPAYGDWTKGPDSTVSEAAAAAAGSQGLQLVPVSSSGAAGGGGALRAAAAAVVGALLAPALTAW